MDITEYLPLILDLPSIFGHAASASEAWNVVEARMTPANPADSEIFGGDIVHEVTSVTQQLRRLFRDNPPPQTLKLLYFGLFTAANAETYEPEAGYYVAGSSSELSTVEVSADLAGGVLDYMPNGRYLESPLLHRIQAAARKNEAEYERYDYVLMLCAAAVLSVFAVRQLSLGYRVVVGFDSGDALEFQV